MLSPLKRAFYWAEEHLRGLDVQLVLHPLECKGWTRLEKYT